MWLCFDEGVIISTVLAWVRHVSAPWYILHDERDGLRFLLMRRTVEDLKKIVFVMILTEMEILQKKIVYTHMKLFLDFFFLYV